jgi:hypothetical protein
MTGYHFLWKETNIAEGFAKVDAETGQKLTPITFGINQGKLLDNFTYQNGWRKLDDVGEPDAVNYSDITQLSNAVHDAAALEGRPCHWNLDGFDIEQAITGQGMYGHSVVSREFRYVYWNWKRFKTIVRFYRNGQTVPPPWENHPTIPMPPGKY